MALTITNSTNTLTFTVGRAGADGADGADGAGIAAGGTTGQVLAKASNTDYDTEWTSAGAGDMLAATYDPTSVAGDAFSMDSMVEGATTKILTATERTKLAGIETGADVTDTANVTAAGALMDSEVTNLAAVKAFDPTDYATAAQGTLAASATQPGDNISTLTNDSGFISSVEGTAVLSTGETGGTKFLREDGDGTCSWQAIPGGGDALTTNPLSQFAATTSAQLAGVISDETGTGALVFANSPTLVTPALGTPSALVLTNATGLPEAQVTAHQAALSITESQISDLGAYITGITGEPLSDLSDVTITTIASGEILKWNGTGWINNTLAEAGIATSAQGALADSALQSDDIDTLAELNAIITDATLIDTTDSRLSDSRPCDGTFDNATTAKTALSLENVENTALSTWTGSTAITTLGTIATGTWQGTAIGDTYISSAATWNAKLANLSEDTTPQLGGSLDVNGNKIVSTANGNIDIEPNGTGNVLLGNFTFDADQTVGAGQDNYVLTYDNGTGLISLEAAAGGGGGNWTDVSTNGVEINDGTTATFVDIFNTDDGAGNTEFARIGWDANEIVFETISEGMGNDRDTFRFRSGYRTNLAQSTSTSTGGWSAAFCRSSATGSRAFSANAATCSGNFSAAFGESTVTSQYSMGCGYLTEVGGSDSFGMGRNAIVTRGNQFSIGATRWATGDPCQLTMLPLKISTTDATPTEMFTDGSSQRITVPTGHSLCLHLNVQGFKSDGSEMAVYDRLVRIKNDGGTVSLVGSVQTIGTDHEDNTSTDLTVTADNTNKSLKVEVTGIAAETWYWAGAVWGTEQTHGNV